ncbi:SAM-dependent DNA methyltransferase [Pseudarthrobacter oxydans]|uniref:SAM-dependent DNA methyltransferase n=1 Tax=Pseudarthrobacter oxydans TaxID=1671 RepID=UPI0035E8BD3C|nr:N-6 DNA methylase [Pseudarthrobacter oxydans]
MMADMPERAKLVKSKRRVADHGEVFTPAWLVEDMLNQVRDESARIDSRFLEPACGSGNFLVPVLRRKLATVELRHGKSDFEKRHYALFALMCMYGIELLADNAQECRTILLKTFNEYLGIDGEDACSLAAQAVLEVNIIQGDALTMTAADDQPITFPEWGYLGKGKYQRRDFRYDNLTQRASFKGSLWDLLEEHEIFIATKHYPTMTIGEIGL